MEPQSAVAEEEACFGGEVDAGKNMLLQPVLPEGFFNQSFHHKSALQVTFQTSNILV